MSKPSTSAQEDRNRKRMYIITVLINGVVCFNTSGSRNSRKSSPIVHETPYIQFKLSALICIRLQLKCFVVFFGSSVKFTNVIHKIKVEYKYAGKKKRMTIETNNSGTCRVISISFFL